jgi:biotin transport system substrate-specific component
MGRVDAGRAARADVVADPRLRRIGAVILFTLLTAVGAYVEVPVPGSPVPVTLQTMFVVLSGALLGARLGASSQALYVLAGALGAPVFAGGAFGVAHLMGPTGGYILAFPLAAAVAGVLAGPIGRRGWLPALRVLGALFIATKLIFVGGVAQLTLLTGDLGSAIALGVAPFVAGDVLKVVAATLLARRLGDRARALLS